MDIQGYNQSLGSQSYSTVTAVLKYIHPHTWLTYHLVINQAIHIPHLPHHLLCPMQHHVNDIISNLPKFLDPHPRDTSHSILCTLHNYDNDEKVQTVALLLRLKGVTLYLSIGRPTTEEWISAVHPCLVLTSEHLTWDPHDISYEQQEGGMTDMMRNLCLGQGDHPLIIQTLMLPKLACLTPWTITPYLACWKLWRRLHMLTTLHSFIAAPFVYGHIGPLTI